MTAPARRAALGALRQVHTGRRDLASALETARAELPDERDRALATDLVTGTLRHRAAIDAVVAHAARRPADRLDPVVLDVLRLGVYQLLYLDRVPAAAIVNDAVDLCRRRRRPYAAGLVNAVLRAVSRADRTGILPPRPSADDDVATVGAYLTVTLSHPAWLVDRWIARYGARSACAWAEFNDSSPPVTLRANRLATTRADLCEALAREGVITRPTRYAPDGLVVEHGHPRRTAVAPAAYVVQDEASQLVAMVVDAHPGERVLDACAAPGGKTTALAAAMKNRGLLLASELRPGRRAVLSGAVRLAGAEVARVVGADLERGLPVGPVFDRVLVDAPCSGLGTLRRDPDIKWRRTAADLADLAARQVLMLEHAAEAVRPGGRLVYATCSSEPEENEGVVTRFLDRHSAFRPLPASALVEAGIHPDVIEPDGTLVTRPDRHGLEAFFAAALERGR